MRRTRPSPAVTEELTMPKPDLAAPDETRRTRDRTAGADAADTSSSEDAPLEQRGRGPIDALAARASEAADGTVELAKGLPAAVDEVAAGTGRVLGDAQRNLRAGSDSGLLAGASLSAGLALGLLVGGAPRLAVILALVTAAAFGITLAERRADGRRLERGFVN
jgi:uncharacterized protein (DUF2342 family)